MPKKVLIALPPAMLDQVDVVANEEHRTRSDLIREALRRYLSAFNKAKYFASATIGPVPEQVFTSDKGLVLHVDE